MMMEWQPIETAPKDGTRIIVADARNVWCNVSWEKMKRAPDRWAAVFGPIPIEPTHWMPLPPPPGE